MATLVEEVLAVWRDAERMLGELPELHADHETVARAVAELRAIYSELTAASTQSRARIRVSEAAVARTRTLLDAARRSIEPTAAGRGSPGEGDDAVGSDLALGGG